MSKTDFFVEVAQQRAQELTADLAEMEAALLRARSEGDEHSARQLIQGIANGRAERRNLEVTYNEYVVSQAPRHEVTSDAEFLARAPERMTGEDIDRIFSKSKYYTKNQWADPDVAARVQAGMSEVQRRRSRGE